MATKPKVTIDQEQFADDADGNIVEMVLQYEDEHGRRPVWLTVTTEGIELQGLPGYPLEFRLRGATFTFKPGVD